MRYAEELASGCPGYRTAHNHAIVRNEYFFDIELHLQIEFAKLLTTLMDVLGPSIHLAGNPNRIRSLA